MSLVIRTERLLLRPFQLGDAPALNRIANQKRVLKWMPAWKSSIEGTEKLIRYFISQYSLIRTSAEKIVFAVEWNGSLIGMVGIGKKKEVDNETEICYFISEEYAGKGYITEGAKAVSRWALENLELEYVIAIVEPENVPSQRVIEKCGFRKIDTRMILNSGDAEEKPFHYYRLYKGRLPD